MYVHRTFQCPVCQEEVDPTKPHQVMTMIQIHYMYIHVHVYTLYGGMCQYPVNTYMHVHAHNVHSGVYIHEVFIGMFVVFIDQVIYMYVYVYLLFSILAMLGITYFFVQCVFVRLRWFFLVVWVTGWLEFVCIVLVYLFDSDM